MDVRVKNMAGKRCGLLTVTAHAGSRKSGNGRNSTAVWDCFCRCGNRLIVVGWALRSGHTTSCGCARVAANKGRVGTAASGRRNCVLTAGAAINTIAPRYLPA
jgi:hypothetical protein